MWSVMGQKYTYIYTHLNIWVIMPRTINFLFVIMTDYFWILKKDFLTALSGLTNTQNDEKDLRMRIIDLISKCLWLQDHQFKELYIHVCYLDVSPLCLDVDWIRHPQMKGNWLVCSGAKYWVRARKPSNLNSLYQFCWEEWSNIRVKV